MFLGRRYPEKKILGLYIPGAVIVKEVNNSSGLDNTCVGVAVIVVVNHLELSGNRVEVVNGDVGKYCGNGNNGVDEWLCWGWVLWNLGEGEGGGMIHGLGMVLWGWKEVEWMNDLMLFGLILWIGKKAPGGMKPFTKIWGDIVASGKCEIY